MKANRLLVSSAKEGYWDGVFQASDRGGWRFFCVRFFNFHPYLGKILGKIPILTNIFCCKENHGCFGGGFNLQRFVIFSPRIFANMIQFDVHTCFFKGWVEKNHQLAVECSHFFLGGGWGKGIFDWLSIGDWLVSKLFFFLFGFYWLNAKQHKSMAMGKLT